MYVWAGGTPSYIATLAESDLIRTSGTVGPMPALTNWTDFVVTPDNSERGTGPGADSSRTTPTGDVLVFESRAALTDYDPTEETAADCGDPSVAGEGCTEVYRYDASEESLTCVSCGTGGMDPSGDARLQELELIGANIVIYNLSDDGQRVFFESPDPLVGRDTDGINDIYEWQRIPEEAPTLDLISPGDSTVFGPVVGENVRPNLLFSVTRSGNDVVFISQDRLTADAPFGGAPVLYDARVGGGFASEATEQPCSGEECLSPLAQPPVLSNPAASHMQGSGNVKQKKHRCRKKQKKGSKRRSCHRQRGGKRGAR